MAGAPGVETASGYLPKRARSRPQHLLELVCKAVNADWGGIGLLSTDGDVADYLTHGISAEDTTELQRSPWCEGIIEFVLQHPVSVNLADLASAQPVLFEAARMAVPHLPAIGPFLGLPLSCHGRCWGALYLTRAAGRPRFDTQDLELVLPTREWLEQGTLFEEARLLAQLRLLNQVAQAAAGRLDLPSILKVALRELERHLPLHVSVVWLLEEGKRTRGKARQAPDSKGAAAPSIFLRLAASSTAPQDRAQMLGLNPGLRVRLEKTAFAPSLRDGQAVYSDLERTEERDNALARRLAARGASASFAVPLRLGKQTVGILQCVCTRSRGFTNEQIQLLYLVADLLGPAISNCRLFRRLRTAYEELRCTQSQLIQAEKMRALGELASGMAHDFNNSLCGVLGFLDLALADRDQDDQARSFLESARTCTLDAAETVRRVQNFARWKRHELSVQPLEVNELVRETIQLTRHKWADRNPVTAEKLGLSPITVEVRTEATALVSGSAAELREVLTNLVFNAVDAMPRGGRLTVRTWSTAADVFFSVQDTGVGMNDSVRQRLFEPFFTTKGDAGNGLGLSVAFGIIQRYGGEILVETALAQGSTFTVRLPIVAAPECSQTLAEDQVPRPAFVSAGRGTDGEPTQHQNGEPKAPLSRTRSLRVLVIEDEESIRRFLAIGLTQLGHSAKLTADAREGLAAFATEPFDVVLTDLGLPGASGEEVARSVARLSPNTPVILLTGWSDQLRDQSQPLEGVTCILGKPVKLQTLAGTLLSVLNGQS
jgi:signal transduction histidine kinase